MVLCMSTPDESAIPDDATETRSGIAEIVDPLEWSESEINFHLRFGIQQLKNWCIYQLNEDSALVALLKQLIQKSAVKYATDVR